MPKHSEMKTILLTSGREGRSLLGCVVDGAGVLATWVPAKAKNKNKKVPTNSPRKATVLFRVVRGRASIGRAGVDLFRGESGPQLDVPPEARERKSGRVWVGRESSIVVGEGGTLVER